MSNGENAVLQAMAFADAHNTGYWLRLKLVDGTVVRGPVNNPSNGVICVDTSNIENSEGLGSVWVALDQVITVQIEW
jgi:hypothetical protein